MVLTYVEVNGWNWCFKSDDTVHERGRPVPMRLARTRKWLFSSLTPSLTGCLSRESLFGSSLALSNRPLETVCNFRRHHARQQKVT